jgi:putative transposase
MQVTTRGFRKWLTRPMSKRQRGDMKVLAHIREHKVTTNSNHSLRIVANVLDGDFTADAANRKWAGDISYIWTAQGWLYLAVILDLHSRRVVGWAVSDRMKKDLAIQALDRETVTTMPLLRRSSKPSRPS